MSDFDFSEYENVLKKHGRQVPKTEPAPAPTTPSEPDKAEEPKSFLQQKVSKARGQAWEGIKHGAADIGTTVGTLAGTIAPPLKTFAKEYAPEGLQEAYGRMERYANEPSKSWQERELRFGTNLVPYGALSRMAGAVSGPITTGLTRAFPSLGPQFTAAATGPVFSPGTASTIGKGAATVLGGAAGGAYTDPEHPGRGAIVGGTLGGVPGAVSNFLRGKYGQSIGAHMIAGGATYAVIHAFHNGMGVPYEVIASAAIPGLRWHSTPTGSIVRRVGNEVLDQTGRVVGTINPAMGGGIAAKAGEATGASAGAEAGLKGIGSWIMNRLRSDPE